MYYFGRRLTQVDPHDLNPTRPTTSPQWFTRVEPGQTWPSENIKLFNPTQTRPDGDIGFSTSIFLGGTHLWRERSERIFLASPHWEGQKIHLSPSQGGTKIRFVSSEGGGHAFVPHTGEEKSLFPHSKGQGVKIYLINRSKLSIQSVNIVS